MIGPRLNACASRPNGLQRMPRRRRRPATVRDAIGSYIAARIKRDPRNGVNARHRLSRRRCSRMWRSMEDFQLSA